MFQRTFAKPDVYHLTHCSVSNDEVCEDDNEWVGARWM